MNKEQNREASLKTNRELFDLNPSTLITLFEIDCTDLAIDTGTIANKNDNAFTIFRFHNNIRLTNSSLFWKGKEYIAAPIQANGFEVSSKGTLPTPKLSMTVSEDGIAHLAILKEKIFQLGDLVGAKVTRIRTFAKYLDSTNFLFSSHKQPISEAVEGVYGVSGSSGVSGFSGYQDKIIIDSDSILDFEPNTNIELPRDIYYIDRKSNENKYSIEYELSSIFDVEGIKLPGRLVVANKCPFIYRGEGCLYEYENRREENIHGLSGFSVLPDMAPAVATERDELISTLIGSSNYIIDKGEFDKNVGYKKGEVVFVEKNKIKYYFVAAADNPPKPPPNIKYWYADSCSKTTIGCKLRFKNIDYGYLPFGGFPSVNRAR